VPRNLSFQQEKADMFGFAVLLWELIFQQKPWKGVHTMKVIQLVIAGSRLSLSNPPAGTPPVVSFSSFLSSLYNKRKGKGKK
jgi:hypothetical protein